jgi:hypothetical protein
MRYDEWPDHVAAGGRYLGTKPPDGAALARDPGHDDARTNLEMALQLRATQ